MKAEIKNSILKTLSDDAAATELCDTAEDFPWVFDYVKSNAQQLRTRFKAESYNTTGDYKTAFFVHGLRAIIATWLDDGCADSPERMNEIVIKEYKNYLVKNKRAYGVLVRRLDFLGFHPRL